MKTRPSVSQRRAIMPGGAFPTATEADFKIEGGATGAQRGRFLASAFPNLSRNPRSPEALRPASGKPSGRILYFLRYIHSRSTPKPSLRPLVIRTFVIDSSLGISSFVILLSPERTPLSPRGPSHPSDPHPLPLSSPPMANPQPTPGQFTKIGHFKSVSDFRAH